MMVSALLFKPMHQSCDPILPHLDLMANAVWQAFLHSCNLCSTCLTFFCNNTKFKIILISQCICFTFSVTNSSASLFQFPNNIVQGWGLLLSRFPPFRYFPNFLTSPRYMLAIEYHVHIWQVSPQLSCGDTCQKWMRFKECSRHFREIENFAYGEIDERSFNTPHPKSLSSSDCSFLVI